MNASSIMCFEDLLKLWQGQHAQQSIVEFLSIRSQGDVRGAEESASGVMRVLHERLDGTWWEVTRSRSSISRGPAGGIRCRYLADSLQDAMRRCPRAQLPPEISMIYVDDVTAEDELDAPMKVTVAHRRRLGPMAGRKSR